MATYKIIQDIEAEDKILGALTLKQFVFAFIAAGLLGLGWLIGGKTSMWAIALFFIPAAPFLFLASPIGKDQPNDVWLGAQLRFFLKPRVRRWSQSGVSELVTITAPKKEEHIYTDGLSHGEVRSHLQTIANSLDYPGRLRSGIVLPSQVAGNGNVQAAHAARLQEAEESTNQNDQQLENHFQSLIDDRSRANKETARIKMSSLSSPPPEPSLQLAEANFLDQIHQRNESLVAPAPVVAPVAQPPVAMPEPELNPAIIKEFSEADDLNVSTIATMAKNATANQLLHNDEVINLH